MPAAGGPGDTDNVPTIAPSGVSTSLPMLLPNQQWRPQDGSDTGADAESGAGSDPQANQGVSQPVAFGLGGDLFDLGARERFLAAGGHDDQGIGRDVCSWPR